jgi:hypothetical protein
LHNAAGDRGASVKFDKTQLPCFTLWKSRQSEADGYVTGLEPGTNFPNPKSFEKEHGRVVMLAPEESRTFELILEAHGSAEAVAAAGRAVAALQEGVTPEVSRQPNP